MTLYRLTVEPDSSTEPDVDEFEFLVNVAETEMVAIIEAFLDRKTQEGQVASWGWEELEAQPAIITLSFLQRQFPDE